ncbi:MAG: NAD/NADP octopine/nopaline dehydrogenase family protein [Bacteroidales bacterium]|nr:NAD/NADP octopine/nopaline dehydrogenase family protein [Bacteroidales bacterium]
MQKKPIAVIGAGNGGQAMAGHLAIMGYNVHLYNRGDERLWGIRSIGGIELSGAVKGFGEITLTTNSIREAIEGVEFIMVVVPANAHRLIAEEIAPFLIDGQIIILHPGRTLGALEFKQVLVQKNIFADVIVAEAQTFIYACRTIGPGQSHIFSIKQSIPVASIRAHLIPSMLKKLRLIYPQFVPGNNVFNTSFDNIGSIFHPAISILNAGWIEDNSDFKFYYDGVTESVAKILEYIDEERIAVAAALGIRALSAKQWLYLAYSASGDNLLESMRKHSGYREILAPRTLKMRYIEEDVPCSLVPIASLGRMLGIPTPTIDALIHLASLISDIDYFKEGRNVDRLGISGMSLWELRLFAIGEKRISQTIQQ